MYGCENEMAFYEVKFNWNNILDYWNSPNSISQMYISMKFNPLTTGPDQTSGPKLVHILRRASALNTSIQFPRSSELRRS